MSKLDQFKIVDRPAGPVDTAVEKKRVNQAIAYILQRYPHFSKVLALWSKRGIQSAPVGTMATDGRGLLFDPRFTARLSVPRVAVCIFHEMFHTALGHHLPFRNEGLGDNRAKKNVAFDAAIHGDPMFQSFAERVGCWDAFCHDFIVPNSKGHKKSGDPFGVEGLPGNKNSKFYFKNLPADISDDDPRLPPEAPKDSSPAEGGDDEDFEQDHDDEPSPAEDDPEFDVTDGSQLDDSGPEEGDEDFETEQEDGDDDVSAEESEDEDPEFDIDSPLGACVEEPELDEGETEEDLVREWREAMSAGKSKQDEPDLPFEENEAGEEGGHEILEVEAVGRAPYMDKLAGVMNVIANDSRSYASYNRKLGHISRETGGMIAGNKGLSLGDVLVIVDTSGTMTAKRAGIKLYEHAIRVVNDVVVQWPHVRVTLVQNDNHIKHKRVFSRFDFPLQTPPEWSGGGGTQLAPAMRWAAENASKFSAVLVISDMLWSRDKIQADPQLHNPGIPVVWCLTELPADGYWRGRPSSLKEAEADPFDKLRDTYGPFPFGEELDLNLKERFPVYADVRGNRVKT